MKQLFITGALLIAYLSVAFQASADLPQAPYEDLFSVTNTNNPQFLGRQLHELFDATETDVAFAEIQKKLNMNNDQNTLVAVFESGFFMEHPGFFGKLKFARDIVKGTDHPNGRPATKVDEYTNTWDPGSQGHGTHVLGIAIGGGGVIGMPVRAFPQFGEGRLEDSAHYAIDKGARVISMSIINGTKGLMEIAEKHPNILFVKAAGNAGLNLDAELDSMASSNNIWADFDPILASPRKNIVAVAAIDSSGKLWKTSGGSNYGVRTVKLAARGANVTSYIPIDGFNGTLGKGKKTGTSMATPLVAGIAGRIFAIYPELTAEKVIKILEMTSFKTADLNDKVGSGGIIDPKSAYQLTALLKLTKAGMNFITAAARISLQPDEKSKLQALLSHFD